MAFTYLPTDRDQPFLLPPDVRDWLPEGHLVWLVLEVVARVDTSVLHARHRRDGVGRRAYDPDMLLALLIYTYCTGIRSSRQIERLCEHDVAYRVLCANHVPDHTTIARFRQGHGEVAVQLFVDVLSLCAAAGLTTVGVVAVDGTKMASVASVKANRTRVQLETEVRALFDDAEATDAAETGRFGSARGDELPTELADPRRRAARLDAALRQMEIQEAAREAERQEAVAAHADARRRAAESLAHQEQLADLAAAARAERTAAAAAKGHKPIGRPPHPEGPASLRRAREKLSRAEAKAAAPPPEHKPERVNVTDPDSRLLHCPNGWVQGYNAQAAVNERGVVVAAEVTQEANDLRQCLPMMGSVLAMLGLLGLATGLGTLLFDAGYCSLDNLNAEGPDRLIATAKSHKLRRKGPTEGDPPKGADPIRAMEHRLRTPEGAALYAKRQHTVEPVFGTIKAGRGMRGFVMRGLQRVDAEWKLIAAAHNILKLHHHAPGLLATKR